MGLFDRFFRPPTKDQFARKVIQVLRQVGDQRTATYDEAEFRLKFAGDDKEDVGTIYLSNLYAEFCNKAKKERSDFLRRTCVGLASQFEVPDDFEDVKPDILPSVRVRSTEEEMRLDVELTGGTWKPLASLPLSEHLEVCLVYDLPNTMHFIHHEELDKWGVTAYEAAEIAKQNLAEKESAIGAIDNKLFFVVANDAYDATRILLVDRIRQLPLAGQPVAMAVNRETLMFAGSDDPDGLGMMADMTEKKEGEPRPLCTIPHMLIGDEWVAWLPPPEHPYYERFRILSIKHLYRDYAEQKKLLEAPHEQTGEELFVATFSAIERDGKFISHCVWSKDVPTLLPKTDYVVFYDGERKQRWIVKRARLDAVVGDLLTLRDCYPPRWFVEVFPTDEQIEQMGIEDWPAE